MSLRVGDRVKWFGLHSGRENYGTIMQVNHRDMTALIKRESDNQGIALPFRRLERVYGQFSPPTTTEEADQLLNDILDWRDDDIDRA